jgi:hypothetical protein
MNRRPTPQLALDFDCPTLPLRWGKGGYQWGWPLYVGTVKVGEVQGAVGGFKACVGMNHLKLGFFPQIQLAKDAVETAFREQVFKQPEWLPQYMGNTGLFFGDIEMARASAVQVRVGMARMPGAIPFERFEGDCGAARECASKAVDRHVFGRAA